MNLEPLIYWAKEREQIRKRKEAGLPQWEWTQDPIFRTFRFCNLRRRDDRVSQWLIKNVFSQQEAFSPWSFIQFTALCRWVNWPPTLQALYEKKLWPRKTLNLTEIGIAIEDRRETQKAWTGAYTVVPPKGTGLQKGLAIASVIIGENLTLIKKPLLASFETQSIQKVWEALKQARYQGGFMAGQTVADWTYTPLLCNATDLYTWAPMGPGSIRGYSRLLGLPLKQKPANMEVWCETLQSWRAVLIKELGAEYEDLTLHDLQNGLCEVSKYAKVKDGTGRPRAKYRPEMAY